MKHSLRRSIAAAGFVALAATSLVACGNSAEENEAAACGALGTLNAALDKAAALTPQSTIDEIKKVRDEVEKAWEDADNHLEEVAKDRADVLDTAVDSFEDQVDAIEGEATLPDAVTSLKDEAAAIAQARVDAVAELDCK